jgi:subtilase family serine protease
MLRKIGSLLVVLAAFTASCLADSIPVKGPPERGHARPPLYINITPSTSAPYSPAQIRHAYGFDQLSATGAGETIAIVDAYGNLSIQADLNTFCAQWGLASTTVQVIGNNSSVDTGWALETALDVEWAHAIAPGATILLSVAASNSLTDLLNAVDAAVAAGATSVSMSWGAGEFSGESFYDSHFNKSGVTFTASSGDGGAGVEWPAVSPYVVSVGGTSLYLDSNNNRSSETGWSGSGGGFSAYDPIPGFQVGWQTTSGRGVPDVSYVADPSTGLYVYDAVNGGWYQVGGTSAGAPQWAALIALVNQMQSPVNLSSADQALYTLAKSSSTTPYAINGTYFYDVSSGSNGAYSAAPTYDFVTGLGSPIANALVPALTGTVTSSPDFALSASPGSQSVTAGNGTSYSVSVTPSGGFANSVTLSTGTLPSGVNATFSANPITSRVSTLTVTTSSTTPAGTYTLAITGTGGSLTHTTSVTLTVSAPPTPNFTISASPTSRSVKRGNSASYAINVSSVGGFAGSVSLTPSAPPPGGTAYLSPTSVNVASGGTSSATLTVTSTLGGTPKGSYNITVTGTGGSLTHSTTVSLRLN